MASVTIWSKEPLFRASLRNFFPVGFILSPIRTGSPPICTVFVDEQTTVDLIASMETGDKSAVLSLTFIMNSGVDPQQPPRTEAPAFAREAVFSAKSWADMPKEVMPSIILGSPAFGCTMIGTSVALLIEATIGSNSEGPSEQFTPRAATPSLPIT